MTNSINLKQKVFFVVTGASKGIGQRLAVECAKPFLPGSVVVLLARTASGLAVTKSSILEANSSIQVDTYAIDLERPKSKQLIEILRKSLKGKSAEDFTLAFIIHNVGTLGDVSKKAKDLRDVEEWQKYYDRNLFSVAVLNSIFMDQFAKNRKFIVNITSICALKPYKSFAFYCSGKAARQMYFKILAEEEITNNTLVLNYSPGPVETDMTVDAQQNSHSDEVQYMFKELRDEKTILTTYQTTAKFLSVVDKGAYDSGDLVDYFERNLDE